MRHTVKGLVLREVKVGESDRILSILVPGSGIISAMAKGALRPKNKLFSATGLFCYSEFVLFEGRTMYKVNEAAPIEVFFGLRSSVEGISVAVYFAELLQTLSPTGTEADKLLRLTLNALHLLATNKQNPELLKAVFEIRAFSESGFMPALVGCAECGKYEDASFFLDVFQGMLLCPSCCQGMGKTPNLDSAALLAFRHIALSEDNKMFSFSIKEKSAGILCNVAEQYVLANLDHYPKSLTFLKSII